MAFVYGTLGSDIIDAQDGVTNDLDLIFGFDGNDLIFGLGGDDLITGGYGADAIYGGSGSDTASYVDSAEAVFVNLANGSGVGGTANGDTLFSIENLRGSYSDDFLAGDDGANALGGRYGRDVLKGGGGADTLDGGEDDDTLKGGGGADTLEGGYGIDTMSGGAGDDIYYVDDGADSVGEITGEGYDTVYSTAYNYTLAANAEVLSLDTANDTGYAGFGNSQHNTLFGNANDNVLDGGGANDILSGLGGNDIFIFRAGQAHGDVVYEFQGNGAAVGDQLQFVGYGPGATFTQASATEWIIASADASILEVITFIGGPPIDPTDYVYY